MHTYTYSNKEWSRRFDDVHLFLFHIHVAVKKKFQLHGEQSNEKRQAVKVEWSKEWDDVERHANLQKLKSKQSYSKCWMMSDIKTLVYIKSVDS